MALVNQPAILSGAFAAEGDKNTIPDNNDGLSGLASIAKGFPPITQVPLAQGGQPPQRQDFNGIFNLFSQFLLYAQNGGVYAYNNTLDYQPPCLVADPDSNIIYQCLQQNGPNTSAGVQALTQTTYWQPIVATGYISSDEINAADGVAGLDSSAKLLSQLYDFATEEEVQAGTDNTKPVNSLGVAQAIDAALPDTADYVVENYTNGTEWYRVWKSGKLEQGGKLLSASVGQVNFLKPFKNLDYGFFVCFNYTSGTPSWREMTPSANGEDYTTSPYRSTTYQQVGSKVGNWFAVGEGE